MKILFVFTGGTIGSTQKGGYICKDKGKAYTLLEMYKNKYGINFDYDTLEPYYELSENNTGVNLFKLANCVKDNLYKDYDGIIVTHGTDTLQYTASALSYALGSDTVPVCIVSSNYTLTDLRSNGVENLQGAVKFIERKANRGVWVPYKNPNENLKIHRGTRLLSNYAFSDSFESIFNMEYGQFDKDFSFVKNPDYVEKADEISPLYVENIGELSKGIMVINPYVGMSYPQIGKDVKYIIHNSFHSGTINTASSSAESFFKEAKERNIKVYLTGTTEGAVYESTGKFKEFNITCVNNIAPISVYVKLWLTLCSGKNPQDTMGKSLSSDII